MEILRVKFRIGTMASGTFTYDVAKSLIANSFTRTGYIFSGWATTKNGIVAYQDKQSVQNLTPVDGATVTLYAVWTPITYSVVYDAKSKTYTLTIKRAKSTDTTLSALIATAGVWDKAFDPTVTKYKLTLPADTDSVTITALKSSPLATVINGVKTYKLKNGQSVTYTISVRSQAGVTKKYTITVYRSPATSSALSNIVTGSSPDCDIDRKNMAYYC